MRCTILAVTSGHEKDPFHLVKVTQTNLCHRQDRCHYYLHPMMSKLRFVDSQQWP